MFPRPSGTGGQGANERIICALLGALDGGARCQPCSAGEGNAAWQVLGFPVPGVGIWTPVSEPQETGTGVGALPAQTWQDSGREGRTPRRQLRWCVPAASSPGGVLLVPQLPDRGTSDSSVIVLLWLQKGQNPPSLGARHHLRSIYFVASDMVWEFTVHSPFGVHGPDSLGPQVGGGGTPGGWAERGHPQPRPPWGRRHPGPHGQGALRPQVPPPRPAGEAPRAGSKGWCLHTRTFAGGAAAS